MLNTKNEFLFKYITSFIISKVNKYFGENFLKSEIKIKFEQEVLEFINFIISFSLMTPNELKTLKLTADGLSTLQIATRLSKTERCINLYKERIREKLDLDTIGQAVYSYKRYESLK